MNIGIRLPSGEILSREVQVTDGARDLIDDIEEFADVNKDDVELLYEGDPVPTSKLLMDLGICDGAEFDIGLSERGEARQYLRHMSIRPCAIDLHTMIAASNYKGFRAIIMSELFINNYVSPLSMLHSDLQFVRLYFEKIVKYWPLDKSSQFITEVAIAEVHHWQAVIEFVRDTGLTVRLSSGIVHMTNIDHFKAFLELAEPDKDFAKRIFLRMTNLPFVQCLWEYIQKHYPDFTSSNPNFIRTAISFGSGVSVFTVLLENGFDPNIRDKQTGSTPLMNCSSSISPAVVQLMIKYGADVHSVDRRGRSVLFHFVSRDINFTALLNNGADPTTKNKKGNSPLWIAAKDVLDLKQFLEFDPSLATVPCGTYDRTVLHSACQNSKIQNVEYLLKKCKVDPNIRSYKNETPLHLLISGKQCPGKRNIAELLVDCGADINAVTNQNKTALSFLEKSSHRNWHLLSYLQGVLKEKFGKKRVTIATSQKELL